MSGSDGEAAAAARLLLDAQRRLGHAHAPGHEPGAGDAPDGSTVSDQARGEGAEAGGGGGAAGGGDTHAAAAAAQATAAAQETADAAAAQPSEEERAWLTPATAARYLRARKGQHAAALEALVATAQWRRSRGARYCDPTEPALAEELRRGNMYVSDGVDRAGRPIIINRKDRAPLRDPLDALRKVTYVMEKAERRMRAGAAQWVWLLDLRQYTRSNSPPLSVSIATMRMMSEHFVERLHRVFLIDAPWVFKLAWNVLWPMIDSVTRPKIVFMSNGDDHADVDKLLEVIAPDQLEESFGGTRVFHYDYEREELGVEALTKTAVGEEGSKDGAGVDAAVGGAGGAAAPTEADGDDAEAAAPAAPATAAEAAGSAAAAADAGKGDETRI